MGAIREFGLFSVIGIVATLVVALTYTPAMLNVLSVPKRWAESAARESWIDRAAEALARFDLDHRSAILAGGVLIAGLAIWGASRLELSSDMIGNFPPDHHVRRDFGAVNESLQGANPFYVVIETDYSDAFTEPANLHEIARLQRWLEEQPEIGGTTSLVDYLRLINRGFNGGDPAYLVIPDDEALIAQLLLFGANDEIKNFVDTPYQRANILVRSKVIDSGKMGILLARIQTRLAELPERLHPRITGNSVLLSRTTDDIARGQVESLSAAFIGIYAILVLLFMSFRIGLIALIPNALPVLGFFGLMGWSGVTLNATTSLIACIVLGIAVDDSIHYLARFNQDSKSLASEHEGTIAALRSVARPVTVTTIGVCLGFLTLTLSELKNQIEFGALSAATLAFAWLIDVTLTPALCSRLRIVSLWDVLSLDLGRDPQLSIPLFRGLSRAQARVVALVSSVRSFPSGERIMSAGEPGDEMYVVIDGELEASVVNEDGRVELGEFGRGDLLGDVAMFHGKRTADVDTTSDVRLLRLTGASLERLARRYPRIAVKVNRNLADVLAERLVKLTERVRN
jgi:predicted RND superfamily exporter protein